MASGNSIATVGLIGLALGMGLFNRYIDVHYYTVDKDAWICTQSVVTNKILPREEACTQYSLKGSK